MPSLAATPEFQAVLAADLDGLCIRLMAAVAQLDTHPGDASAQAALAATLHSLKGLAGMAGARPLGGAVRTLEDVFERGVRLAREGDEAAARQAFGFCRGPGEEMALLISETAAGRGGGPEAVEAVERLRAARQNRWPEATPRPAVAEPSSPLMLPPPSLVAGSPAPVVAPDRSAVAAAGPQAQDDVLAFLQELGVGGPTGPVQPPAPPPPEVRASLVEPLWPVNPATPPLPTPVAARIVDLSPVQPPSRGDSGGGASAENVPPASSANPGDDEHQRHPAPSSAIVAVSPEEVDTEMLQYFLPETLEYCESIDQALAVQEDQPVSAGDHAESPSRVLMRLWHTIKGAANSIGLVTIGRMAHAVEDACEENSPLPANQQRAVAGMAVEILRDYLRACGTAPAGTVPTPPVRPVDDLLAHVAGLRQRALAPQPEPEFESGSASASAPSPDEPVTGAEPASVRTAEAAEPPTVPAVPAVAAPLPSPAAPVAAGTEDAAPTFEAPGARVDPTTLDRLMDLVGELTVSRNRLLAKVATFTGVQTELEGCKNRLLRVVNDFQNRHEYSSPSSSSSSRAIVTGTDAVGGRASVAGPARPLGFGELEFDEYDDLNLLSRALAEIGADTAELIDGSRRFFGDFAEESDRFRKVSTQLQETLTAVRMVPLSPLFRRLRRVALEAAGKEGKEIVWETEGGDTRLDKVIVEEVFGPLLHLVRNAVGHGVETPERRETAGKPREGHVVLRASQRGSHALIELTDDGGGLDFHAIRARGLATGLIGEDDADHWDEEQLVGLLFQPGFSTRTAAERNDVGGRGVGLDVVLQQVTRLNGTVEVESNEGTGCTWRLKLPMTLAIGQAMFVEVGGQTFALPLAFVERLAFRAPGAVYHDTNGDERLVVDGLTDAVPLLRLEDLLGLPAGQQPASAASLAVVVRVADKRLAFPVGGLGRRAEIVTKPLPALLADHPFFSGATLDNDGRAVLILDVPRLAGGFFARRGLFALVATRTDTPATPAATAPAPESTRARLLIVDDSLSVRKVSEKLATELGYEVVTAADGQAALDRLEATDARPFDAVLTDLEMPRLDGFGLLTEIRSRAALRHLPVLVVTSRQADKHRRRAAELGATDYLVKPFSKAQLADKLDLARGIVPTATPA